MKALYKSTKLVPILFFSIICSSHAQNWQGKITYKYILNLDSTISNKDTIGKEAILFFTPQQTYFVYHSRMINTDSASNVKQIPKYDPNSTTNHYLMKLPAHLDPFGEIIFTDISQQIIGIREFVFSKPIITEEKLPKLDWHLTKEEKYIGKIKCQKAVTSFRGRVYEAWFSSNIPVNAGPWKLQGLPGLILEASDVKKQVQFKFQAIEIPLKEKVTTTPLKQTTGKVVTYLEYKTMTFRKAEKMAKFMQSSGAKGSQTSVKFDYYPIEID